MKTIEISEEHLQFFIRHTKTAIRHMETHGAKIPARMEQLQRFRSLLDELERVANQ